MAIAGSLLAMRRAALRAAEKSVLVLHANGTSQPDDFGIASSSTWLPSGPRRLQASIVRAAAGGAEPVAVLLFHGRGETISDWAELQAFLGRHRISSMVFDYSGHGSSTPPAHVATLNADASAAYGEFLRQFPGPGRRCIVGHSMGVAPMLSAYPSMLPAPDCTVVANAFSSLEAMARDGGAPAPIAVLLRSTWNNLVAITAVRGPLLLVHSDADRVIAPGMARRLDAAAPPTAVRITLNGFEHNALYRTPNLDWWAPVIAFLKRSRCATMAADRHGEGMA